MAVADGAVLRIVASFLFPESVIAQNVFYAVFTDNGTSDDEQDVTDDVAEWVEDAFATLNTYIPSHIEITGVKVYVYDSIDDDWDEIGDAVLTDAFAGTGDMLPHGASFVLHAKTTDPDVQGAKFIGGLIEGTTDEGLFSGGIFTAMANFADAWTTAFVGTVTGALFGPGVWSPTRSFFYLFNGVEVLNSIVGYQRRRKPGVGI